jgi:hypothetical protein
MKESAQQEIPVPEVGKNEFVSVLRFVYTGDANVVTEENVVDILEAANYFSETRLKCVCEDILKRGAGKPFFLLSIIVGTNAILRYRKCSLRFGCSDEIRSQSTSQLLLRVHLQGA